MRPGVAVEADDKTMTVGENIRVKAHAVTMEDGTSTVGECVGVTTHSLHMNNHGEC